MNYISQNQFWFLKRIHDSIIHHFRVTDGNQKENLGILVQYKVKIKLFLGALGG